MPRWLYLATCVLVPPLWGWLMVRVVDAVEQRRKPKAGATDDTAALPPIDYVI